jgi:HEAT repeat protein
MKTLGAINDERVIPFFIELSKAPSMERRYAACANLAKYNNDQAYETLLRLMKTTGAEMRASATTMALAESSAEAVRHYALIELGKSPHPKALPLFWTFAKDDDYRVRLWVLHRAYQLQSPEALKIIKELTKDKDATVSAEAQRFEKEIDDADSK